MFLGIVQPSLLLRVIDEIKRFTYSLILLERTKYSELKCQVDYRKKTKVLKGYRIAEQSAKMKKRYSAD